MGLALATKEYYDNSGGLDLKSSPTKVADPKASLSLNMDYSTDGAFYTRNGSTIQNVSGGIPVQMAGAPRTLYLYDFKKSDGTETQIVCAGTTIKHGLTSPTNQVTGLDASLPIPDIEKFVTVNDEFAVWGNGSDNNLKFDGTTWTNLSIARPAAPVIADNGVGALVAGDYEYYYSFAKVVLGQVVEESELSPVSNTLTLGAARQIRVTIAASADSQVNARVIYRVSPTSLTVAYRHAIVNDNVALFYDDNNATDGTTRADFNQQAAPKSAIFEEYLQRMIYADADRKTDLVYSPVGEPFYGPTLNRFPLDAEILCIRRIFGALIIGTTNSLWVQNGDFATNSPRRISSIIGITNNRCAVGEDILYILATNRKVYAITPTDFSQDQMRLDKPLSLDIDPIFANISGSQTDKICMEYYTKADVAKVVISAPTQSSNNDYLIVYNESQSLRRGEPCWYPWDNISASALRQMVIGGDIGLYSGDYNGFLWLLDDETKNGDGAEQNGTVTSATNTTLTDNTQNWTVNAFVGMRVRIISGTGEDQVRVITANTATQVTVSSAWSENPDDTSEFTIGGYDAYHFSNWKFVLTSFDVLKQLWFLWFNANASGDYNIELILQFDFDQSLNNQTNLLINLQSSNTIWGDFIWGLGIWGARAVFQDRLRQFRRFRAVRLGFRNRKAGQPYQINGFSLSCQNKGLFFRSAA